MTETKGWYELREDLSREVIDRNWTSAFLWVSLCCWSSTEGGRGRRQVDLVSTELEVADGRWWRGRRSGRRKRRWRGRSFLVRKIDEGMLVGR